MLFFGIARAMLQLDLILWDPPSSHPDGVSTDLLSSKKSRQVASGKKRFLGGLGFGGLGRDTPK